MSRDLRRYARQTNIRLIIGFILLLLIIGDGLILLFYGRGAAITGLICIFAGLAPVILILVALWIIDLIVRANNIDK
jgi:membrane protein implicated in regulation of membrane protease activity